MSVMFSRILGRLVLVAVLLLLGISPAMPAQAALKTDLSQTQIADLVTPNMVQIGVKWQAKVWYLTDTGLRLSDDIVTAGVRCSGFFVSKVGHIVTAAHCLSSVEGRLQLINQYLAELVDKGFLTQAEANDWDTSKWRTEPAAPTFAAIYAGQAPDAKGAPLTGPIMVQKIDDLPYADGDLALLRANVSVSHPLAIANAEPNNADPVTTFGFPDSVPGYEVNPSTLTVLQRQGIITNNRVAEGSLPLFRTTANVKIGMDGGATVDRNGQVVGVNTYITQSSLPFFNYTTRTLNLRNWLVKNNNVPLASPPTSMTIWVIIAGVLLLVAFVVVGLSIVFVLRHNKRKRTAAAKAKAVEDSRVDYGINNSRYGCVMPVVQQPQVDNTWSPGDYEIYAKNTDESTGREVTQTRPPQNYDPNAINVIVPEPRSGGWDAPGWNKPTP